MSHVLVHRYGWISDVFRVAPLFQEAHTVWAPEQYSTDCNIITQDKMLFHLTSINLNFYVSTLLELPVVSILFYCIFHAFCHPFYCFSVTGLFYSSPRTSIH